MKKSLVALAVLAASGASIAQSTVTVYGIVDIALANVSGTAPSKNILTSGGVSASRWGLKGSEDLGGGMKANFQLEQGFDADTGVAGAGFSRQSWVGFSGGFGEVKIGRTDSAYSDAEGGGASAFASAVSPFLFLQTDFEPAFRVANQIKYSTPSFGGVNAGVSYSLDESNVAQSSVTAIGVAYDGGPLTLAAAFQSATPKGAATTAQYSQFNATYDLKVAKLLGTFGRVSGLSNVANQDVSEWQIGADVPVSAALTVSGGYASTTTTLAGADVKTTGFGLAGAYSLSKRTTIYGGFGSNTVSNAGVDTDTKTLALGVKHTF
jgi:predicted porin